MEIQINQAPRTIPDTFTVQQLLSELFENSQKGLAVAVNNLVIRKSEWPLHLIQPDDNLTIIRATQGG